MKFPIGKILFEINFIIRMRFNTTHTQKPIVDSPKKIAHRHRAVNAQQQNPEEKTYDMELRE